MDYVLFTLAQFLGFVEVVRRESPRERPFLQSGSSQVQGTPLMTRLNCGWWWRIAAHCESTTEDMVALLRSTGFEFVSRSWHVTATLQHQYGLETHSPVQAFAVCFHAPHPFSSTKGKGVRQLP
jgi:hypothetical protein